MLPPLSPTLATRLRAPGYVLLALMSLVPMLDNVVLAWPVRPSQLPWRFSAFGQLSAGAAAPLLALILLYALAFACADRNMLLFCTVLAVAYTLLLVAAAVSFPMDALQMRRRIPQSGLNRFTVASVGAVLRLALYSIASAVLTVSLFRSQRMVSAIMSAKAGPSAALVMGKLSGPFRPTPAASPLAPSTPASVGAMTDGERAASPEE